MLQVDRLYEAVAEKSPVCVGLDTDFSYIPAECVDKTLSKGENIFPSCASMVKTGRKLTIVVIIAVLIAPDTSLTAL